MKDKKESHKTIKGCPTGIPRLLTPERTKIICDFIAEGNYLHAACAAAGIGKRTYNRWLEQAAIDNAAGESSVFTKFADDVHLAEGEGQARLVKIVKDAAESGLPNTWQAACWILERKWPALFGKRVEIEVTPSKLLEELRKQSQELARKNAGSRPEVVTHVKLLPESTSPESVTPE